MTPLIYVIRCIDGRGYVGGTTLGKNRWKLHKHLLRHGRHSPLFQEAWDQYGADAFEFIILEYVTDFATLLAREQHWLDATGAGDPTRSLNMLAFAGSPKGSKQTPEANAKRAAKLLGHQRSPEEIEKSRAGRSGKKRSPEQVARIRAARWGN